MNSLLNPSLGFASRPGESVNPRLWDRLRLCAPPCLGFGGRNLPDLSSSRFDLAITGTAYSIGMSPIGPCLTFTGNAAMQQSAASWGLPCKFLNNSVYDMASIHAYFKYNHSAGAKESTIFWSDNPTAGSLTYGYRLYVDNNTDKLKLKIANGDDSIPTGTSTFYTSNKTLTGGRWYNVVITWTGLGRDAGAVDLCSMWIDGIDEGYLTITPSTPSSVEEYCTHLTTQNARIGATLGSVAPDHSVALVNVWNRELSRPEINQINTDPLAMFRRRRGGGGTFPKITTWWNDRRRRVA